jgi:hypothetical protein
MGVMPAPEYDGFADQARQEIQGQQAVTAPYQGLAKRLLAGDEVTSWPASSSGLLGARPQ